MATTVSVHDAIRLRADTTGTVSAPLIIAAFDADEKRVAEVVFYVEDQALADALATAINDAVASHSRDQRAA